MIICDPQFLQKTIDLCEATYDQKVRVLDNKALSLFAARGSQTAQDWIQDFKLEPVTTPIGVVHEGFWEDAQDLFPADNYDYYSGHSLGAAISIYMAALQCLRWTPPKAVIAWEPPRHCQNNTLTQIFDHYGVEVLLFRNGNDLVTDLPPEFFHCAPLIPIGKALLPFPNIEDHLLENIRP